MTQHLKQARDAFEKLCYDYIPTDSNWANEQKEIVRQALTQAIAIKRGECVVSREMRLTIEGMAKQPLTTELDDVAQWSADYTDGYDEMVKHARKLKAMIAAQEERG